MAGMRICHAFMSEDALCATRSAFCSRDGRKQSKMRWLLGWRAIVAEALRDAEYRPGVALVCPCRGGGAPDRAPLRHRSTATAAAGESTSSLRDRAARRVALHHRDTGARMGDKSVSRLSIPVSSISGPSSASSRTHSRRPSLAVAGPSKSLASPAAVGLSPLVSRSHSHLTVSTTHSSRTAPSTPVDSPSASPGHANGTQPRRLLMPTVRPTKQTMGSPKIPHSKASPSKMTRSRAGSGSNPSFLSDLSDKSTSISVPDWVGGGRKFEIVEEQIELTGYQIYAVEKW